MLKTTRLTTTAIDKTKAKSKDIWLSDDVGTRGGGRLVVRISTSGSKIFYFRYSINGKRDAVPIGPYSMQEMTGRYTLDQARQVAIEYAALYRDPATRNVKAYLANQELARQEALEAAEREAREAVARAASESKFTLDALCAAYVKHLRARKKQSARTVETQVALHITPTIWGQMPAKAVTAKHITALLRKLVSDGKGPTAKHLRSFLHAAYSLALKSELDASTSSDLEDFGIEVNPVASTASLSQFSKARERCLSPQELGEVWRRLSVGKEEPPLVVRALRLVLLLGGQRGEQLLRVSHLESVDLEALHIVLHDPKGNRSMPRVHLLPLVGPAIDEVKALIARSEALQSKLLFQGASAHLSQDALSKFIKDMSRDMITEGISKQQFQFSDLRRTVETSLAKLGINKDIRAQLQSHGIGGVQDRHYDMHEYYDEKQAAIKAWQSYMISAATGQRMASNVRRLDKAA